MSINFNEIVPTNFPGITAKVDVLKMASEHLHISGRTVVQHVRDVADFRRELGYRLDFGAFGEKPRS